MHSVEMLPSILPLQFYGCNLIVNRPGTTSCLSTFHKVNILQSTVFAVIRISQLGTNKL